MTDQKPPHLMPFQDKPFNGDTFVEQRMLELKKDHNIKTVVETGTCLGVSTEWFSKNFDNVITVEINPNFLSFARVLLRNSKNVKIYEGDSSTLLSQIISENNLGNDTLFFLDSHWEKHCPLADELQTIKDKGLKPIIVIHDFLVPEHLNTLGYDTYNGTSISSQTYGHLFASIYDNYKLSYNSPDKAAGAMRGLAYIEPFLDIETLSESEPSETLDIIEPKE